MAWLFALSASHSTRTQLLVISCVGIIKSCFLAFASDVLRLRRDVEINFNIILWSFYLLNVCTLLFTIVISFSENRWHVLSPSNKFYTFHAIVGDTSIWLPYFNTANAPRGAKLYSCCSDGIIKIFSSYALLRMSDAPKKKSPNIFHLPIFAFSHLDFCAIAPFVRINLIEFFEQLHAIYTLNWVIQNAFKMISLHPAHMNTFGASIQHIS